MSADRDRRRWRPGLRLRYAVMATALAALTFGIGGAVALRIYHNSLVANVESAVHGAARAVSAAAKKGTLPDPIPMPVSPDVPRIQVLDAAGNVTTGDPTSADAPPMLSIAREATGRMTTVVDPANLPERRAATIAIRTAGPHGPLTIIAAGSLDPADNKAAEALDLSAVVGGITLVIVALVAWFTAGRTLRRVERLRAQVSAITANGDLARRVLDSGGDELAYLGSTLNQMLEAMESSTERQRRFVADAAHELRTPIAGLTAALEVSQRHPETVDQRTWTAELVEGHRRLGRLVNELLELASLDAGAPSRRQPTDLAGVVADSIRRSARPGIDLHTGLVERATVMGDPSQLTRIIANLVDNALRYATSSVEVNIVTEGSQAVITVTDDGPGIPASQRERIWERFVRLDENRARSLGGTGLGLALAKDIVRSHHGSITATNSQTGGAIFTVRLPLSPPMSARSAIPHRAHAS